MAKVLIPLNNTPWGVEKHKMIEDEYNNVLSFDSADLKAQYIGKELFNNVDFDYRTAIDKVKHTTPFVRKDDLTAKLKLDIDYVNETIDNVELKYTMNDLLNVDFLIIKEDDEILFYIVDGVSRTESQNNVTVEYDLVLDVMFNYFDDLQIDGDVLVNRGHTERHNGRNFIKKYNRFTESMLGDIEPYKLIDSENLYNREYAGIEFTNNSSISDISWWSNASDVISSISWQIHGVSLSDGINSGDGSGTVFEQKLDNNGKYWGSHFPYNVFINPTNIDDNTGYMMSYRIKTADGSYSEWGTDSYDKLKDDSNLISSQVLKGWPLEYKYFKSITVQDIPGFSNRAEIIFEVDATKNPNYSENDLNGWSSNFKHTNFYYGCNTLRLTELNREFLGAELNNLGSFKPAVDNDNYNLLANIDNEVKMATSKHKNIFIEGKIGEPYKIEQEYIGEGEEWDNINLSTRFLYTPTNPRQFIYVRNSENYGDMGVLGMGYFEKSLQLPAESSKYNEYIAQNSFSDKHSVGQSVLSGLVGTGVSAAAGAAAGSVVPGFGTATGAIVGTATGATTAAAGIVNAIIGRRNDRKNTQNAVNEAISFDGDIALLQLANANLRARTYGYDDYINEMIFDFYLRYGYELNVFGEFDYWKNTRYYYNYMQISEIYSNIRNRLSPDIKTLINNIFKSGFTVWHVRDLDTFKGIKNYKYENVEMSVLDAKSK